MTLTLLKPEYNDSLNHAITLLKSEYNDTQNMSSTLFKSEYNDSVFYTIRIFWVYAPEYKSSTIYVFYALQKYIQIKKDSINNYGLCILHTFFTPKSTFLLK